MNEWILINNAFLYVSGLIIGIVIMVLLIDYLKQFKKIKQILYAITSLGIFIYFFIWVHGWDESKEYLQFYWIMVIISFIVLLGLIINSFYQMNKKEIDSNERKNS